MFDLMLGVAMLSSLLLGSWIFGTMSPLLAFKLSTMEPFSKVPKLRTFTMSIVFSRVFFSWLNKSPFLGALLLRVPCSRAPNFAVYLWASYLGMPLLRVPKTMVPYSRASYLRVLEAMAVVYIFGPPWYMPGRS